MSKWKYKRGDVFIEDDINGDPIGYRVILGSAGVGKYFTAQVEVSYDEDLLSDYALENWFELCDHKTVKFVRELTPEVCEDYLGYNLKAEEFDRKHEAMLHKDDLNEILLCLALSKMGCDETVAETGDPEVKARVEHINKIINKISAAKKRYE